MEVSEPKYSEVTHKSTEKHHPNSHLEDQATSLQNLVNEETLKIIAEICARHKKVLKNDPVYREKWEDKVEHRKKAICITKAYERHLQDLEDSPTRREKWNSSLKHWKKVSKELSK